jgi:hypothetical protein
MQMRISWVWAGSLAVAMIATFDAGARAGSKAPITMDGPVAEPCKTLHREPGDSCTLLVTKQLGKVRAGVFLVAPDAADPKGLHSGAYYLAVQPSAAGWLVAPDPLFIAPYWREHGGGHHFIPDEPHVEALTLTSGPAVAMDVPIEDAVDGCNDAGSPGPPTDIDGKRFHDIGDCQAATVKEVAAHLRARRRAHPPLSSSPIAVVACGVRPDGTWACIPPQQTALPQSPIARFRRDGRWFDGSVLAF